MVFQPKPWPRELRSQEWYGGTSRDHFYHRVQTGDRIAVDGPNRRLTLEGEDADLAALPAVDPAAASGYARRFHDPVEGADTGADFDVLRGCRGSDVARDCHR